MQGIVLLPCYICGIKPDFQQIFIYEHDELSYLTTPIGILNIFECPTCGQKEEHRVIAETSKRWNRNNIWRLF